MRLLSKQNELTLIELGELCWRAFVVVSVVALSLTPWLWLWSRM